MIIYEEKRWRPSLWWWIRYHVHELQTLWGKRPPPLLGFTTHLIQLQVISIANKINTRAVRNVFTFKRVRLFTLRIKFNFHLEGLAKRFDKAWVAHPRMCTCSSKYATPAPKSCPNELLNGRYGSCVGNLFANPTINLLESLRSPLLVQLWVP